MPEIGYFASGFRGEIVGRQGLIALVESERHCEAPKGNTAAARPSGATGPTIAIEATADGARGVADLGTAEYQDEYVKTPLGWQFASRTVIIGDEKAVGLDASGMLAIQRLGGAQIGDHYEADQNRGAALDDVRTENQRFSRSGYWAGVSEGRRI